MSLPAEAQSETLSLADALQLGRQNYPAFKASEKAVAAAEEGIRLTRTQRIPVLRVSEQINYGTSNATAGIQLPYGTIIPTTGSFTDEASYAGTFGSITTLYGEWAPVTFGQYQAKLDEAQAAAKVVTAGLANDVFAHQIRIARTYLELLAIDRFGKVQQQDVDRVTTLGRIINRMVKNGLRPGVDTEFANAEVAKAKLALFDARIREQALRMDLATQLGLADQSAWLLDSVYITVLPKPPLLDSASVNAHPQLSLLQQSIRLSDARTQVYQRSYRPRVGLIGGVWARGSGIGSSGEVDFGPGGIMPNRLNYALGVGLTFDLLDVSRVRSQVRQQVLQTQSRQDTYRQARLELGNQLMLANRQLQVARLQAEQAPVQLQAASRAFQQQSLLYNEGLGDLTAVTQALYNLRKAETDQLLIINRMWQTLLTKAAATGSFDLFFNAQ